MIENLIAFLLADGGVAAEAGTKIWPAPAPEDQDPPFITIQTISRANDHHNAGVGLEQPRFQIDSYGSSYDDAKTMARAIRTALDAHIGAMSGYTVLYATLLNEMDLFDEKTQTHRILLDFRITGRTAT